MEVPAASVDNASTPITEMKTETDLRSSERLTSPLKDITPVTRTNSANSKAYQQTPPFLIPTAGMNITPSSPGTEFVASIGTLYTDLFGPEFCVDTQAGELIFPNDLYGGILRILHSSNFVKESTDTATSITSGRSLSKANDDSLPDSDQLSTTRSQSLKEVKKETAYMDLGGSFVDTDSQFPYVPHSLKIEYSY